MSLMKWLIKSPGVTMGTVSSPRFRLITTTVPGALQAALQQYRYCRVGDLENAAFQILVEFAAIVQECQSSKDLPKYRTPCLRLSFALLFPEL
jgi:hypothetical protein